MPSYDASHYDPPAPVAVVVLRDQTSGAVVPNILLLIDTGADVTLLPRVSVERLGAKPIAATEYELVGFDGQPSKTKAVELDMIFLGKIFRGRYLLIDAEHGILGRDVLSSIAILLDGPGQTWSPHHAKA